MTNSKTLASINNSVNLSLKNNKAQFYDSFTEDLKQADIELTEEQIDKLFTILWTSVSFAAKAGACAAIDTIEESIKF